MASPAQTKLQHLPPRLYLVTPQVEDAPAFSHQLAPALVAGDIAAVLLRLAPSDERTQINRIKALAPVVQGKEVALLLEGHAGIAAHGNADGAHLTGLEAFATAFDTLKPARIAGCGGLASRHDAMTVAERGADYVMFGDPVEGRRPSIEAILERVSWWAEMFEVPCVAMAESLGEVGPLAAAGAEFVAIGDFVWKDARGVAATIAAASAKLILPEPVA